MFRRDTGGENPMNFVVIGIDHRLQQQDADRRLEGLLRGWLQRKRYFEPLQAVAEEYDEKVGESIAQRLAHELGLHWYNVDMTRGEKQNAGILEEQQM